MKKLILVGILIAIASPAVAQTALEKEMAQRLQLQVVETKSAKWQIEATKAENSARLARSEAEYKIQQSRLEGMCESIMVLQPDLHNKLCK